MAVRKLKMGKFHNHSSHGWRRRPWQEEALVTWVVSRDNPSTCYVTSVWSRHSHISTLQMRKSETWRVWGLPGSQCSVQFSSVTQLCLTLCDPMDCSMPAFSVCHQFPELAQTHIHQVSDAIQTSHPLPSPFPPAFSLSQHQGLFQGVSCSHQVAKATLLKSGELRWLVQVSTVIKTWNGNIIT